MRKQKKVDIVLYSLGLKRKLKDRLKELGLKVSDVVKDAHEQGMNTITKEKMSRYFNSNVPIHGYPTQADILWLTTRYGIEVRLNVKLSDYDETTCKTRASVIRSAV